MSTGELISELRGRETDILIESVKKWGRNKGINNPYRQLNKVTEELGEWAHEINRDRFDTPEARDSLGDTLTTIIILADICGIDPIECLEGAYNEISDRSGHTSDGMFIKEEPDSEDERVSYQSY